MSNVDRLDFDRIYKYHPAKGRQEDFVAIRSKARELAELIDTVAPPTRERSLAFTKIEEAVMWANAAIARWASDE